MPSFRIASLSGLALLIALPVACGDAFLAGSGGDDAGADAGDSSVVDGPGGGDSSGSDGMVADGPVTVDGGLDAGPTHLVYVSQTTGSDNNDGLTPAKPKKTIASGLGAAALLPGAEVHVCKGFYIETALNLSKSMSLRGSYDCASWTRTPNYGFPSFDGVNETIVEDGSATAQAATLLVSGSVGPLTTIDGFNFQGASAITTPTIGVEFRDTASAILANDVVSGGSGRGGAGGAGSIGILIGGGSSPEVKNCVVGGGSGNGALGSVGISVTSSGMPRVHDDVVVGGTGTASSASGGAAVGVEIASSLTGTSALTAIVVDATGTAGTTGNTAGISIGGNNVSVDVVGCEIQGGLGSSASTASVGVAVATTGGSVRILDDRIYGGDRTGPTSNTFGVVASGSQALTVENTMIHAGAVTAGGAAFSVGIEVGASPSPQIIDDTIYTGSGPGYGLLLGAGVTGARVTDDLFVGAGAGTDIALSASACSGEFGTIDHTAFSNFGALYACSTPTATTAVSLTALYADLATVAASDVIVETAASCGTDVTCVAQTNCPAPPTQCLPAIFGASWTTSDDGLGGLLTGTGTAPGGWTLPAGSPCAIARGGVPVGGITTDIYGTARSPTKPTIGAAEYAALSCN